MQPRIHLPEIADADGLPCLRLRSRQGWKQQCDQDSHNRERYQQFHQRESNRLVRVFATSLFSAVHGGSPFAPTPSSRPSPSAAPSTTNDGSAPHFHNSNPL